MSYDHFVIARAIHVLCIVFWIGGVAFVTIVLIPAIRKSKKSESRLELFECLEGKFSFQEKITTLLTGLSGAYMLEVMDAWSKIPTLNFGGYI